MSLIQLATHERMRIETSALKPKPLYWIALALLVTSVSINYADRGNLGVAATSIERELHLTQGHLGLLLGAFSITYAVFQILAGKLIDRWNVNWVYAGAFLLWSGATGLTGLSKTFLDIFCLRLLLGAGESVAYPAYSKMIAISFPEQLRGTANGLIDAGSKLGPALGVLLGVKIIGWFSWRGMFLIIGAASLVWLIPWCLIASRLPGKRVARSAAAWTPSYRQIMSKRALWGTALGLFGGNYTWFFFLNWLPYYFENDRHYTHDRLAIIGSLPFWTVAASSTSFGLFADWLIRRGRNPGSIRQRFVCFGLLGCCIFMLPAVMVSQQVAANSLLLLAFICMGAWSSNHWAFTQLLSGPQAAGKWTGLQNCLGNFAGVVGPYVSGIVLEATHSFFAPFAIACTVLVFAVAGYWIVVEKPVEISWHTSDEKSDNVYMKRSAS